MATTVIKTCDKCGQKMDNSWGEMDVTYTVEPEPSRWFSLWSLHKTKRYELCSGCARKLQDWFL